ncbi:lipid kinase [Lichenihabitans sp. PAMC28606]|uniref:lipid kinase n=1 Tax=Lichenihabitans sp. PAMC28606 TaxID=2880932 RepID=UPI001D0A3B98|nr:lipid kinase [Lichenihabitans sp. PAMC28606]UDL96294.1 lipid kinase [Lichenihabitans sp. PAMC28606]
MNEHDDTSGPTSSIASDHLTKPALLIVNTKSRNGAAASDRVFDALETAGIPVRREACEEASQVSAMIRLLASEVDRVVLGGGDGTLNAALPGLLHTGLPLGIIPLGTANDLARTLGLPIDPVAAAQVIAAGNRTRIDIGKANEVPFFNVASIGFGVDLTRALTRDAKKRWGTLGYLVAGIRALQRLRSFTIEIEQDGTVQRGRTIHLAIGNGRHYGGGMTVSEDAAIDDGRLNVYSLEVRKLWQLMMVLPSMRHGRQGRWKEVRTLASADITVRTRRERSVNTDGEITTKTPARFRVLPRAIEVYVP